MNSKQIEGLTPVVINEKGESVALVPEANFTVEKGPTFDISSLSTGWLTEKLASINMEQPEGQTSSAADQPTWQVLSAIRTELSCSCRDGDTRRLIETFFDNIMADLDRDLKKAGAVYTWEK